MRVPNSESGHKMPSLEGENEIPHIPVFDFLTILAPYMTWEPTLLNKICLSKKNTLGFVIPTSKV